jgi:hypothetical protein
VALLATLLTATHPAVSLSNSSLFVLIGKENTRGTIEVLGFRLVLRQQKSLRTPRQTAVTSVDFRSKDSSRATLGYNLQVSMLGSTCFTSKQHTMAHTIRN